MNGVGLVFALVEVNVVVVMVEVEVEVEVGEAKVKMIIRKGGNSPQLSPS